MAAIFATRAAQFLALCVFTFLAPAGSFDAKTPAQAKGEALLQELRGLGELQNSFVEFLGVDADGRFIVAHERDDEEDDEDGDSDDSYGRRRQVVFQIPSTHLHSHSSLMDRTLRHFLRSFGIEMSTHDVQLTLELADDNGDHTLDLEEFGIVVRTIIPGCPKRVTMHVPGGP